MYVSIMSILDTSRLYLNLIVIPLFFNRRTYPIVLVSNANAPADSPASPTSDKFILTSCLFPDKYRFPRVAGRQAGFGFDIIALLRKLPRRVPAVLLICLVSLSRSSSMKGSISGEKGERNIPVKAEFIQFFSDDRNKSYQMDVLDKRDFI